jgi:hypothetical protein
MAVNAQMNYLCYAAQEEVREKSNGHQKS